MARRARRPVFVGRDSYRIRRWRDAARMLPVLGLVLWLVPLLWPPGQSGNRAILIYIFGVWGVLILAAWLIAPRVLADAEDEADTPD